MLFTDTSTKDFVIERLDVITILSACSSHGAKIAPLLGELALALIEGQQTVPEALRPSLLPS